MTPLAQLITSHPRMKEIRTKVRTTRDDFIDQPVTHLRATVRAMRQGAIDVLYLGDSSLIHVSPSDRDRRRLGEMVAGELGDDRNLAAVYGPGYSASLYAEFVRILSTLPQRPSAVIVSMCIRTSTSVHVTQHPAYGYAKSLRRLQRIGTAHSRMPAIGRRRLTEADYRRFESLVVETRWRKARTIGEYRRLLRGTNGSTSDVELSRVLFDYFHGEVVQADNPALRAWTELGRQLRAYGVPVIAYRLPLPVERGEQLFPGEFATHVESNFQALEAALAPAAGPMLRLVRPGLLSDEQFIDCRDGTEHLSEPGRLRVANAVAVEAQRAFRT